MIKIQVDIKGLLEAIQVRRTWAVDNLRVDKLALELNRLKKMEIAINGQNKEKV